MSDDFDWNRDDSVVVRTQLAVAVYKNDFGDIVIRQHRDWCEDEDPIIVLSQDAADRLVAVLRAVIGRD